MKELQFLTLAEVRRILRRSTSKVYAETRACRLRVHRFGRLVRITADDLDDYIRRPYETPGNAEALR